VSSIISLLFPLTIITDFIMETPVKRPALFNKAIHCNLPLGSFETPDSTSSGHSDFNFVFSNAGTPQDRLGSLTPITPPSSYASQLPSSQPHDDPFGENGGQSPEVKTEQDDGESFSKTIKNRPIWPLRQVKIEQDGDKPCSEARNSHPTSSLNRPKNIEADGSEKINSQEDRTFQDDLNDYDWKGALGVPSKSSQNFQYKTEIASESYTTAFELITANGPTSISTTLTTHETVIKSEMKDSIAAQQNGHFIKDIELSASTTDSEKHAKIALNAFGIELFKILPHQMKDRFQSAANRCTSSIVSNQHRQCQNRITNSERDLDLELSGLSLSEPLLDIPKTLRLIESIVRSSYFCSCHQRVAIRELKKLVKELTDLNTSRLSNDEDLQSGKERQNRDLRAFRLWIKTLSGDYASKEEVQTKSIQLSSFKKDGTGNISNLSMSTSTTSVNAPIQGFVPYHSQRLAIYNADELLLMTILRPLTKREQKKGSIYLFWFQGKFGYIKIGATTRNTKTRLSEWGTCCKQKPEDLHNNTRFSDVPHVLRVETLIQAELKEKRRIKKCESSETKHNEFFEVQQQHAIDVINKWVEWMNTRPYEKVFGQGDESHWRLKAGTLAEMMKPITPCSTP
jgi:hypothetical protein